MDSLEKSENNKKKPRKNEKSKRNPAENGKPRRERETPERTGKEDEKNEKVHQTRKKLPKKVFLEKNKDTIHSLINSHLSCSHFFYIFSRTLHFCPFLFFIQQVRNPFLEKCSRIDCVWSAAWHTNLQRRKRHLRLRTLQKPVTTCFSCQRKTVTLSFCQASSRFHLPQPVPNICHYLAQANTSHKIRSVWSLCRESVTAVLCSLKRNFFWDNSLGWGYHKCSEKGNFAIRGQTSLFCEIHPAAFCTALDTAVSTTFQPHPKIGFPTPFCLKICFAVPVNTYPVNTLLPEM